MKGIMSTYRIYSGKKLKFFHNGKLLQVWNDCIDISADDAIIEGNCIILKKYKKDNNGYPMGGFQTVGIFPVTCMIVMI